MKSRISSSAPSAKEIREMIAGLSPAERASLKDPDFITEDEADLIICDRRTREDGPPIPLAQVLKELGITPRRRRSA